tara:strand:- start:383 stop:643 length:261 start_codon:yes stop_codon:yes gene_type:complete
MTIETAIEDYKREKKEITDKINEYKSELAKQNELLEQADDNEAHVIGDKIGYLNKELKHLQIILESVEDVYKRVLGNEIYNNLLEE